MIMMVVVVIMVMVMVMVVVTIGILIGEAYGGCDGTVMTVIWWWFW